MRIFITPIDQHPVEGHDGDFSDHREPFVGSHLVVSADGVWLDRKQVLIKDRRRKVNRVPGHPWMTVEADPTYWTGFTITVEP